MKVRIPTWSLVWRFLVSLLVVFILVFFCAIGLFIDFSTTTFMPWDFRQPLLLTFVFLGCLAVFIPSLVNGYYTIENDYFIIKRVSKEYVFTYSNVEYIDEEASRKKHKVIFYAKGAKMQYLIADKDNILLETLLKKCKNVKSKDRFLRDHPEEK